MTAGTRKVAVLEDIEDTGTPEQPPAHKRLQHNFTRSIRQHPKDAASKFHAPNSIRPTGRDIASFFHLPHDASVRGTGSSVSHIVQVASSNENCMCLHVRREKQIYTRCVLRTPVIHTVLLPFGELWEAPVYLLGRARFHLRLAVRRFLVTKADKRFVAMQHRSTFHL